MERGLEGIRKSRRGPMAEARASGVAAPASAASTRSVEDADLDRVATCVRGWDTRFTQLGPGPGRGSVVETVLPSSRLVRLQADTPVALEALPLGPRPDELFHIGAISFEGDRPLWQGFSVRPDMLMLEEGEVSSSFALPAVGNGSSPSFACCGAPRTSRRSTERSSMPRLPPRSRSCARSSERWCAPTCATTAR